MGEFGWPPGANQVADNLGIAVIDAKFSLETVTRFLLSADSRLGKRHIPKTAWSFWSGISRKRKAAHAAHVRSGDHKKAPGPLARLPSGVPSPLGSSWTLPVQFRHANRQQHCSAGVVEDIPI